MLLLQRKLSCCLLHSPTPHTGLSSSHHTFFRILFRLSTLATQNPPPKSCFMAEYLIASCGLPLDKAIEVSKRIAHIKSPSQPDSVIHFLRQCGLDDTQIRKVVIKEPKTLCANVEKTLKPKIRVLQGMGFSQSALTHLVTRQPHFLRSRDLGAKIELLQSFSVTSENLLKAISRDRYLLSASFAKKFMPNISVLRECGIPNEEIGKLILRTRSFMSASPHALRAKVRKAEELGVSWSAGMFCHVLGTLICLNEAALDAKFKFLRGLEWSDADISAAIRKSPNMLTLSEKNIRDKVSFFTTKAGCEPLFLAQRPVLLEYSLEMRVVPRYSVLKVLKNEGLFVGQLCLVSAIMLPEDKFIEKFVIPYEKKIPGLRETYIAASAVSRNGRSSAARSSKRS